MYKKLLFYLSDNWALLYAQRLALKLKLPLHVCFCLVPTFLGATIRQFGFMLKGTANNKSSQSSKSNKWAFFCRP